MLHHIKRTTKVLIIGLLVLSAVSLTAIRVLLPEIQQYRQRIDQELTKIFKAPVHIGKIGADMRGFEPQLILTDITIAKTDADVAAIKLDEIRISLDLLKVISNQDVFSAGRVTLVGAALTVKRKIDGSIAIEGLSSGDSKPLWLLRGEAFELIHSQITWQDELLQGPVHVFSNIDAAIKNDFSSQQHQVHIRVNPSSVQKSALRLSIKLIGDIFSAKGINGQVYVAADNLQIKKYFAEYLPATWQMPSGHGEFRVWSEWQNSRLVNLAGNFSLDQVRLIRPQFNDIEFTQVASEFNWQRQGLGSRLDLTKFTFEDGQQRWPEIDLSLSINKRQTPDHIQLGLAVTHVQIEEILKLAQLSGYSDHQDLFDLAAIQAQGAVKNLLFFVDTETEKWAINAVVEQLQLQVAKNSLGVSNFSGTIKGDNETGIIILNSNDLQFTQPGLFKQPITISQLQGQIGWSRSAGQWHFSSDALVLNTPVLTTRSRGQFDIADNWDMHSAFVNIQSQFSEGDLPNMKAYWPVGVLTPDLVEWLDTAYVAGRISQGNAIFYGALADYPFVKHDGLFEVQLDVQAVELAYQTDWPHFINFDAHIHYRNDNITLTAPPWRLNGVDITETFAQIPSVENSDHLFVRAKMQGKIERSMGFLQRTPLKEIFTPISKQIALIGNHELEVEMQIPLIEAATATVKGVIHLQQTDMKILSTKHVVTDLMGSVHFNEKGVYTTAAIAGKGLGHPMQFSIAQNSDASIVTVDGDASIANLQDQFPGSWWNLARGWVHYQIAFTFPEDPLLAGQVLFSTDLNEVSLKLPGTLAKTAEQIRPLTISATLDGSDQLPMLINYDDQLQLAITVEQEQQQLLSGEVLLGTGVVDFQDSGVFKLQIQANKFNLDPWLALTDSDKTNENSVFDKFNEVNVNINQLVWQEQDLSVFKAQFTKLDDVWHGQFVSVLAAGQVHLPTTLTASAVIKLDLDFVDLSKMVVFNVSPQQQSTQFDRQTPIILKSKEILWQAVDLGNLSLESVVNNKGGADIKAFELTGSGHKLNLHGNWSQQQQGLLTWVAGKLEVDDLGALLTRLNITQEIYGSPAIFDFSFSWPGAPYQVELNHVQGNVNAKLQQGSLLGIEPGAGRVLGAFDLTEWKRRVQLDFSDVVAKGLAYNGIEGVIYFNQGVGETDEVMIDGVSAKIEISGKTGLVNRDYALDVMVTPKTTAVIPFAGTIAGLVVQGITGSHPDSLTRSQYQIKGSWDQPEVLRMPKDDGVLRKAWSEITGFSQNDE